MDITSRSFLLICPPLETPLAPLTGLEGRDIDAPESPSDDLAFVYDLANLAAPASELSAFRTPIKVYSSSVNFLAAIRSCLSLRSLSSWVAKFLRIMASLVS